jgi:hypothetical protein
VDLPHQLKVVRPDGHTRKDTFLGALSLSKIVTDAVERVPTRHGRDDFHLVPDLLRCLRIRALRVIRGDTGF